MRQPDLIGLERKGEKQGQEDHLSDEEVGPRRRWTPRKRKSPKVVGLGVTQIGSLEGEASEGEADARMEQQEVSPERTQPTVRTLDMSQRVTGPGAEEQEEPTQEAQNEADDAKKHGPKGTMMKGRHRMGVVEHWRTRGTVHTVEGDGQTHCLRDYRTG